MTLVTFKALSARPRCFAVQVLRSFFLKGIFEATGPNLTGEVTVMGVGTSISLAWGIGFQGRVPGMEFHSEDRPGYPLNEYSRSSCSSGILRFWRMIILRIRKD